MERFTRGLVFWALLLASIALPVSAQNQIKKQLYGANVVTTAGAGVGTAIMIISTTSPNYMVRTFAMPNQTATKVSLASDQGTWSGEILLCENGGDPDDDCTYDSAGNLDIEGYIVGPMLPPGLSGGQLIFALQNGFLRVKINNGSASGLFARLM